MKIRIEFEDKDFEEKNGRESIARILRICENEKYSVEDIFINGLMKVLLDIDYGNKKGQSPSAS